MGVSFNCLLVMDASSSAARRPKIVTERAASLIIGAIVRVGVFKGIMLELIMNPAIILPQARRLIGLITRGSFSLIGVSASNRGLFIETKKIIRRL